MRYLKMLVFFVFFGLASWLIYDKFGIWWVVGLMLVSLVLNFGFFITSKTKRFLWRGITSALGSFLILVFLIMAVLAGFQIGAWFGVLYLLITVAMIAMSILEINKMMV